MAGTIGRRPNGGVQLRRSKRTMWSTRRQTLFLEALAESCNVAASAKKAGLTVSAVYWRKNRDGAFQTAWREAIRQGFERLELQLLKRALDGTKKPVFHAGKKVGEVTEYDDARALQLFKLHREEALAAAATRYSAEDDARVLEELRQRFATIRERLTAPLPETETPQPGDGDGDE